MPKHWYRKISEPVTEEDEFNNSICVDRKPYFMSYIYPDLRKDYNKFLKAQNQGLRRTSDFESAKEFFNNNNPVNDNGCVMNRLCHMVENAFSDYRKIIAKKDFDPEILKTELKYNKNKYNKVFELYRSYCERKSWLVISGETIRTNSDTEDDLNEINLLKESFIKQCHEICSNEEELCNIVVDICYSSKGRKTFAWEMCGDQIIKNLLAKNDNKISYITKDKDGDIEYHGDKFSKKTIDLNTSAL